jgi:hypothetical protein
VLVYIKNDAALLGPGGGSPAARRDLPETGPAGADGAAVRRLAAAYDRHQPAVVICANTIRLRLRIRREWLRRAIGPA